MAEATTQVVVTIGKDKYNVTYVPSMTFGDIRAQVALASGLDKDTFRFLCKGRSVKDTDEVFTGEEVPPAVLKVLALRTKTFHNDQADNRKRASSASSSGMSLSDALESTSGKERNVQVISTKAREPRGDSIGDGDDYVVVRFGRERYNVLTASVKTVLELKSRLSEMEGVNMIPANMNLLFSGRKCSDAELLTTLKVKRGSMFMLLGKAGHHDTVDSKKELGTIRTSLVRLEARSKKLKRDINSRLVDNIAIVARLGELESEAIILKDQLRANRCEETLQESAKTATERVDELLDEIRGRL